MSNTNSSSNTIQIVCCINDSYTQHCAAMLASLFESNPDRAFRVFVIGNIKPESERNLQVLIEDYQQVSVFVKVHHSMLSSAPVSQHYALSAYYKLLIPQLVDQDISKILYLDSDMIIRQSINELWNLDVSNYSHAAVNNANQSSAIKQTCDIPEEYDYFNSGVMLINLDQWRSLDISTNGIQFIQKSPEKIQFVDQDVLNYLLYGKWLRINPTWNAQRLIFFAESPKGFDLSQEEWIAIRSNPAVVHFEGGGEYKPWHINCNHPFKEDYYVALRKTAWRDFRPAQVSWIDQLRKRLRQLKNKIRYRNSTSASLLDKKA